MAQNSWHNPVNKPFVSNFDIDYNCESISEYKFKIFITTFNLINIIKSKLPFHCDTTYKLNYKGYPLIVIGCTTMNKSFIPFGSMLSVNVDFEDYYYLFETKKII